MLKNLNFRPLQSKKHHHDKKNKPDSAAPIKKSTNKNTNSNPGFKGKTVSERSIMLNEAVNDGDFKTVVELLKTNINPNRIPKPHNGSPLTNACRKGCLEIVKVLIEAGADVNLNDKRKERPLKVACNSYKEENIPEIVRILLKSGAKPDLFNKGEDGSLTLCHYVWLF